LLGGGLRDVDVEVARQGLSFETVASGQPQQKKNANVLVFVKPG